MTRHRKAWIRNHELEIFSSNPCSESRILACVASHVSSQRRESKYPKWIQDFFGSKTEGFRTVFGREHVFCAQGPVQGPDPSFFFILSGAKLSAIEKPYETNRLLMFPEGRPAPTHGPGQVAGSQTWSLVWRGTGQKPAMASQRRCNMERNISRNMVAT